MTVVRGSMKVFGALLTAAVLAGCVSKYPLNQAPVEDRVKGSAKPAVAVVEPPAVVSKVLPGVENTGKPGYYTVKAGDTLIRIGLDSGQNWRDLQRWNKLENPNQLEVGQVLQVVAVVPTGTVAESGVVTRPVVSANVAPVLPGSAPAPSHPSSAAASAPTVAASAATVTTSVAAGEDELLWLWPAGGALLRGFDEVNNKGLDLGGKAGDPVLAAMDGRVVYAGAGLRGYGNLIILKHNNTYLSAYAHNQTLLVKEDQNVHKGQKIAEMGSSDTDRVKLHFEIRRQGKPVDPAKFLPAR
jgi:lipoprotein NlpD